MKRILHIALLATFLITVSSNIVLAGKIIQKGILLDVHYKSDGIIVLKVKTSEGIELWEVSRNDSRKYALPTTWRLGKKITVEDWRGASRYHVSN